MHRCLFLAAAVAATLAPAYAQQPVSTQILLAGNTCTDEQGGDDAVIATCKRAIDSINQIARDNPIGAHESNLYWTMMALAHTRIGSSMGAIDHARSGRACYELEEAWKGLSALKPDESPPDYASQMRTLKAQGATPVKLCRADFGTPSLAPPVP